MKSKQATNQNERAGYLSPVLEVIDVTVEQNILADGSANGLLNDMDGELW